MNFLSACQSLRYHWQRAVLSGLGVMVASVAIILLISIGVGVQKDITSQVEGFGASTLIVLPGQMDFQNFNPNISGQSYLTDKSLPDILAVPGVRKVARWSFTGGGIKAGKKEANPFLIATSPEWFDIYSLELSEGRVFGMSEDHAKVCVLGSVARTQLFGKVDPLGKSVRINGLDYQIIGVIKDKGSENSMFSMQSLSNVAYIPLGTVRDHHEDVQLNRFFIQLDPKVEPKRLVKQVGAALGKRLDDTQYSVLTQEDLLGLIFSVMSILSTLVVGLTSIALFVGGIGVMATMMMSVNERAKEIGVRKAVGAKRKDIFWQFVWESSLIGVSGVTVGLGISSVVIFFLLKLTKIKPLLTPGTVLLAFGIGVGIGTIFGLIPAMKAASKDPIASLRNES